MARVPSGEFPRGGGRSDARGAVTHNPLAGAGGPASRWGRHQALRPDGGPGKSQGHGATPGPRTKWQPSPGGRYGFRADRLVADGRSPSRCGVGDSQGGPRPSRPSFLGGRGRGLTDLRRPSLWPRNGTAAIRLVGGGAQHVLAGLRERPGTEQPQSDWSEVAESYIVPVRRMIRWADRRNPIGRRWRSRTSSRCVG